MNPKNCEETFIKPMFITTCSCLTTKVMSSPGLTARLSSLMLTWSPLGAIDGHICWAKFCCRSTPPSHTLETTFLYLQKTVGSEHSESEVSRRMPSEAPNVSVMVANEYSLGSQTDKIADHQNQLMMQILWWATLPLLNKTCWRNRVWSTMRISLVCIGRICLFKFRNMPDQPSRS